MNGNPWGLSGPEFLWIYAGLLILPALAGAIAVRRLRSANRQPPDHLPVYHLAYLTGGPWRTAETAIAALLESEHLRIDSSSRLYKTGTRRPTDPIERAVFDTVGSASSRTVASVVDAAMYTGSMTQLRVELENAGLLASETGRRRIWRFVTAAYGAVLVLGIVRAVAGTSAGYPIGYLVLMMVAVVVAGALTLWLTRRRPSRPTEAGWRARDGAAALPEGPVRTVLISGLTRHPDREIRVAMRLSRPRVIRRPAHPGGGYAAHTPFFLAGGSQCSSVGGDSGGGSSCGGGGGGGCGGGGSA
ncbi:TIGR04222 domain-containing membrane protein [Amycolatopsis suaedae]|uniref:TIGR04222 domain-containing membrane protein n=1 Tax=Amycolatopsis suaedae TaxID=2510978 RepID=A0A4Q7J3K5_9PSEU|nr:TIGR04222 domain-containing membrane protein [Amycolatopsis suaedae]RZQ61368.1 TIGR04222 domain-containing membrane protein [Amycolatopsis suaedae]